jgi:hypothetical protein
MLLMRPNGEYVHVQQLIQSGLNDCAISRATGIPRRTILDWRVSGKKRRRPDANCPICADARLDGWWYTYLLGLYLGDGCLAMHPRAVFKLRIVLDVRYPAIIEECTRAIRVLRPGNPVGNARKIGCREIYAYWKHWPCLFPQHGSGPKHLRKIRLSDWQAQIAADYPERLLRGLVQSDGCRFMNRVNNTDYPRYMFTNNSDDIREIFCRACEVYGVAWRQSNWKTISIARAPDVAKLDLVIGPKLHPTPVQQSDKADRSVDSQS